MIHSQILSLIKQVDTEFSPAFSISNDIDAYVNKIIKNAVLFEVTDRGVLMGLIAMYCNDLRRKVAYVTMVAVDRSARKKGIATSLMHFAIHYAMGAAFEKMALEVYKSNVSAIKLYRKLGFEIAVEKVESYILELHFYNVIL